MKKKIISRTWNLTIHAPRTAIEPGAPSKGPGPLTQLSNPTCVPGGDNCDEISPSHHFYHHSKHLYPV